MSLSQKNQSFCYMQTFLKQSKLEANFDYNKKSKESLQSYSALLDKAIDSVQNLIVCLQYTNNCPGYFAIKQAYASQRKIQAEKAGVVFQEKNRSDSVDPYQEQLAKSSICFAIETFKGLSEEEKQNPSSLWELLKVVKASTDSMEFEFVRYESEIEKALQSLKTITECFEIQKEIVNEIKAWSEMEKISQDGFKGDSTKC